MRINNEHCLGEQKAQLSHLKVNANFSQKNEVTCTVVTAYYKIQNYICE